MNAAARLLNQGVLSRGWVITVILSRLQFSLYLLLTAIIVSALSIVYVTNTARTATADMQRLMAERNQLHVEWNQLLLEQGTLSTQTRVQHVAVKKLNMVMPNSRSVVVINE